MAKYNQLNNSNLTYILNPDYQTQQDVLNKRLDLFNISTDVNDWYVKIEEYGYLVELDSKAGFMYIVSECHTSQRGDTDGLRMALNHGKRTVNNVIDFVCEAAEIIAEQPCEVYVGNCTGTDNEHELCVFFLYGTDIDVISKTIRIVHGTLKELVFKKWNSLVDVIIYG